MENNLISMEERRAAKEARKASVMRLLQSPPDPVALIERMAATQRAMGDMLLDLRSGHLMHNDAILELYQEMKEQRELFNRALKGLAKLAERPTTSID